jgi:ADP-dependent NAD(P)H-hydrate dehydratase / NAD(P)H-hydrate epimerase
MTFEPLYSADEMRRAEAGHEVDVLMQRAGEAVARAARLRFPDAQRFTVVCGGGANGGDGRIAAETLRRDGVKATVVDAKTGAEELGEPDVVIDALFGTGFRGQPRAPAAALIERMNTVGAPVLAVDVPSGVDASTGEVAGPAVNAAATVTFHGRKVGLLVAPGRFHAGEVEVADIGLETLETSIRLVDADVLREVPARGERDNKYTAGHALVVGGSRGLTGAASLAAAAALRADAGYVTVAAPASSLPVLEQRLVEAVKRPLQEDDGGVVAAEAAAEVLGLAAKAHAVALGPGLGRGKGPRELVRRVLADLELPVVVDADALYELEPARWPAPRVLTPHEGELARLLDRESAWVAAHRLAALREANERFACVVLLKGADTLVGSPDGGVFVVSHGRPSLATAGTGDVLTGILAAFLSKGMVPVLAAVAAAAAQQQASALAPGQRGLVASDLVETLPQVLA